MSSTAKILAKGSFLRTTFFGANIIAAFFLMPFIIHSLGDKMYGLWSVIGSFMGFYGLFDFGFSSAVQRYLARAIGRQDKKEADIVVSNALFIFLGIGILTFAVTIAVVILTPFFFKNISHITLFRQVVFLLGFSLAIGFPMRVFIGILNANLRYDMSTLINIAKLILRVVLIFTFLRMGYGILALALITLFTELIWYISIYFSARSIAPDLRFSFKLVTKKQAKELFNYSRFTFMAQIADKLRFNIDDFVIAGFMGLQFVTIYAIASRLISYFIELIIQVLGIFTPVFSQYEGKKDYSAIREKFVFATKLSGYLSIFIGGMLIMFGKAFITRWMGQDYAQAYPILVVLVIPLTVALMQSPSLQVLYGISKHKFFAISNSIEGLANLILSLILVRRFGLMGVALGTAIPMIIIKLFVQPVYTTKAIRLSLREYYLKLMLPIVIKSARMFFIFWWFTAGYILPNYFNLITLGLLMSALFLTSIFFIGLNKTQRNYFKILFERKATVPAR